MKNNTILVLPDIHGRTFWKKPCEDISKYKRVIFLGDYLDPYDFEGISVKDAIENFKEIIEFKKKNKDKVILLIGNHDCPYYSRIYYGFSSWHCRHSTFHHNEISELFEENKEQFQIAYTEDDILFTHAGVDYFWFKEISDTTDINKITDILNSLTKDKDGLLQLYKISDSRGGRDRFASCIWADVNDMSHTQWILQDTKIDFKFKQVFGHTLQAFYNKERKIEYGEPYEEDNLKMIDCARAYELNTKQFKVKEIQ